MNSDILLRQVSSLVEDVRYEDSEYSLFTTNEGGWERGNNKRVI